ncbi:MAG TPA: quercetin 2,3-dioxygenase, partial [Casimicrobiaceae bacterium]|nr:quercetin 2,3-dioxygenase [Casimicrobiaceae bacterium]
EEKRNTLRLIAAPDGAGGAVRIHQDARLYATVLDGDDAVSHALAPARRAYVHVVTGAAHVNDVRLEAGDAAKITGEAEVRIDRAEAAEVLLFDLP